MVIYHLRYTRLYVSDGEARLCSNACIALVPVTLTVELPPLGARPWIKRLAHYHSILAAALLEAVFTVENVADDVEHGLYYAASWDGIEVWCLTPCNKRSIDRALPSMTGWDHNSGHHDYVLLHARPVYGRGPRLQLVARCEPRGWTIAMEHREGWVEVTA